ncbi:MAG: hypothetical protein FD148_1201 [Methylocystaceae bacterium]|nr:MAG: hypothetical protein FD148_1201 [Methylocystaceae bacterium]
MSEEFDRRLTPARPEVAAAYLKGRVSADRYVEGVAMEVRDCVVDLRRPTPPSTLRRSMASASPFTMRKKAGRGRNLRATIMSAGSRRIRYGAN